MITPKDIKFMIIIIKINYVTISFDRIEFIKSDQKVIINYFIGYLKF